MVILRRTTAESIPSFLVREEEKAHRISTVVEPCETGESGHEVNYDGTERKQSSNVTVEITWTGCWDVTCG